MTVLVGQQIDVHMLQEFASPASQVLVPVYPLPHTTDGWVLARTSVSPDQATATYTAMHPGHATLITEARCVPFDTIRTETKQCPVVDVAVISG